MSENEVVVEAWNSVLFEKFTRFKHLLIAGLAGYSNEVFSRALYPAGAPVLDVGCGFGTMFFMNPGAALLHIRRALKPGGSFTQIVWRKRGGFPQPLEVQAH